MCIRTLHMFLGKLGSQVKGCSVASSMTRKNWLQKLLAEATAAPRMHVWPAALIIAAQTEFRWCPTSSDDLLCRMVPLEIRASDHSAGTTLHALLTAYMAEEVVQHRRESCGFPSDARCKVTLSSLKSHVMFMLKRYTTTPQGQVVKLDTCVCMPSSVMFASQSTCVCMAVWST
jgi:hypothetical protein